MKRVINILLTLVLVFGMTVPVLAEDTEKPNITMTLNSSKTAIIVYVTDNEGLSKVSCNTGGTFPCNGRKSIDMNIAVYDGCDKYTVTATDLAGNSRTKSITVERSTPTTEEKKPTTEEKKPTTEEKKPTTEEKKPTTEEKKPTTEEKKPTTEEKKTTTEKATTEEKKATTEKATTEEKKPTTEKATEDKSTDVAVIDSEEDTGISSEELTTEEVTTETKFEKQNTIHMIDAKDNLKIVLMVIGCALMVVAIVLALRIKTSSDKVKKAKKKIDDFINKKE